jgi:hypothetical protein
MFSDPVARYGRKWVLAVITLALGFVVTVIGLALAKGSPQSVAEIVGTFGILASVAIGAYTGSNAWVSGKYAGGASSASTVTKPETTQTPPPVPPRPSGAINPED